jgi:hypothetical protein
MKNDNVKCKKLNLPVSGKIDRKDANPEKMPSKSYFEFLFVIFIFSF